MPRQACSVLRTRYSSCHLSSALGYGAAQVTENTGLFALKTLVYVLQ